MGEINKEKIITLLNEANKALEMLKEYQNSDKDEILSSYKEMSVVKYNFIILIEASIDICNHISAKLYKQAAESYSHCFTILSDKNIIDRKLGTELSIFAKFRNVIVHLYWKVDDKIVINKLNDLDVFEQYFETIVEMIA